jgi:hypothetical protein
MRTDVVSPHFATPEAAMTYLAQAWNSNNWINLAHVTNPEARDELSSTMVGEAVDLKLDSCEFVGSPNDYQCNFTHGYPPGYPVSKEEVGGVGHATFYVGPAKTPGWYMTVLIDCG